MAINKVYSVSDDTFRQIIQESESLSQCSIKLGYANGSRYSYDLIKRRVKELNLDISHYKTSGNGNSPKYSLEEILVENSTYQNMSRLKLRLINENILEYKCAICGNNGWWQDKELILELDHINGNHTDNRIENLRFLCPNCHSQTPTFCTRQCRTKSK